MKNLLTALLIGATSFSSTPPAMAATKSSEAIAATEVWQMFMAQAVAFQPKNVGANTFLETFGAKSYLAPGKEFFTAAPKVNSWPTITAEGNSLVISEKGANAVTLSLGQDGKVLVNGRVYTYNPKQSALKQMREFLSHSPAKSSHNSTFSLIPEAYADDNAIANGFANGTAGLAASYGTIYVAGFLAAASAPAWVVGGIVYGAVAGMAGSVVCGGAIATGYVKGDTFGGRYVNCLAKPLSWIGQNPRDRLYMNNFECKKDQVEVFVASASGEKQTRTFNYEGEKLATVDLADSRGTTQLHTGKPPLGIGIMGGETGTGKLLSRPKNDKQLDSALPLLAEAAYFQRLCKNPSRRLEVLKTIKGGTESVRVYDEQSPGDLNKSAE